MRGYKATSRKKVYQLDSAIDKATAAPDLTVTAVREQLLDSNLDQNARILFSIPSILEKNKVVHQKKALDIATHNKRMITNSPPLGFAIEDFPHHDFFISAEEPIIKKSFSLQSATFPVPARSAFLSRYTGLCSNMMCFAFNNFDIALKLIKALHEQGKVNTPTYVQIVQKYGIMQGGIHVGH